MAFADQNSVAPRRIASGIPLGRGREYRRLAPSRMRRGHSAFALLAAQRLVVRARLGACVYQRGAARVVSTLIPILQAH